MHAAIVRRPVRESARRSRTKASPGSQVSRSSVFRGMAAGRSGMAKFRHGGAQGGGIHGRIADQLRFDLLELFPQAVFLHQAGLQQRLNIAQVAFVPAL